jgi:hypothetical protein
MKKQEASRQNLGCSLMTSILGFGHQILALLADVSESAVATLMLLGWQDVNDFGGEVEMLIRMK